MSLSSRYPPQPCVGAGSDWDARAERTHGSGAIWKVAALGISGVGHVSDG